MVACKPLLLADYRFVDLNIDIEPSLQNTLGRSK